MKRREFVKKALPGALAGTAAACGTQGSGPAVVTHPRLEWRLVSSFPRSLDTIFGAAEVLAQRVEALSDGRFRIHPYPAGEIVPGLQVMDAVQQGTVQIGHSASYYFTGKNPALAFDTCVPFGLSSRQQTAWLEEAGGLDLMRGLFADFDIVNLPGGNTGVQMGGWFQKEITSLSDLQGLIMRIPGQGGEVMTRLGVNAQVLAGGDIYPALERGAIDATEWVGPYDDEKLGFYKIAKYYYYPGWWEPGPSLSFYINRKAWDQLPSTYQQILEVAAQDASVKMQARYDARNPGALERLLANGVLLRRFSDEILRGAEKAATEMQEEQAAKDPAYRKIYEAWSKTRRQMYDWFGTAELAYGEFAFPSPEGR